jgi:hypothetical protein
MIDDDVTSRHLRQMLVAGFLDRGDGVASQL